MSSVQPFIQIDNTDHSQVQTQVEKIIAWSREGESPKGYFASFFKHLHREILAESDWGRFVRKEDVRAFNLALANRYLKSFFHQLKQEPVAGAWQQVFDAAEQGRSTVFQHILMGTTAILRYDAPLVVAELFQNRDVEAFEEDFLAFQLLAANRVYHLQQSLTKRSATFRMANVLGNTESQLLGQLSTHQEVQKVWERTLSLVAASADAYPSLATQLDEDATALVGKLRQSSGKLTRKLFSRVSRWENQPVSVLISEVDQAE